MQTTGFSYRFEKRRFLTLHSRGDRPFSWGIVVLGILGSLSIRAVLSPIARACVFWSRNTDYTHTCGNWFVVQLASEDNAVPNFDVAGLIFTAQYGLDRALAWRGHIQFRTK